MMPRIDRGEVEKNGQRLSSADQAQLRADCITAAATAPQPQVTETESQSAPIPVLRRQPPEFDDTHPASAEALLEGDPTTSRLPTRLLVVSCREDLGGILSEGKGLAN